MANILNGPKLGDIPNISYGELIFNNLRNLPLRIVQIEAKTGETLTNHDLLKQSVILAKELEKKNINVGSTVMISSGNTLNYFITECAIMFTGACLSLMNPEYLEEEIRRCLNISKPQIIFVSRSCEKKIYNVIKTLSWKIELIQMDNDTVLNGVDTINNILKNFELQKINDNPNHYQPTKISQSKKHEAIILYSSGTTGLPKGVVLSSFNLIAHWYSLKQGMINRFVRDNVYIMIVPFFHGYAFGLMTFILSNSAQVVFMKSFDLELFCMSIEKYRITSLPLVPPIMILLAKHPEVSKYDLSSVQHILCGAAPLAIDIREEVQKRFGSNVKIQNVYGMTEALASVTTTPYDSENVESVGCIMPNMSCKVIDPETFESLGENKTGELCFKGDNVMLRYKGDPEATQKTIDRDGWLHTGDLGYYDRDGFIYIVGRLKELIKFNGYQVAPLEIENILLTHADVDDAAVFGQDHEKYGQVPVALVILKPNVTVTPQQLIEFVNERVSPQKYLRGGLKIVKSIPKNATGKILRRQLPNFASKF